MATNIFNIHNLIIMNKKFIALLIFFFLILLTAVSAGNNTTEITNPTTFHSDLDTVTALES